MDRRPFLRNLTAIGGSLAALPLSGFSSSLYQLEDTTEGFTPVFKFITASDGHFGQPDTDFETSHKNLIKAIQKEKDVDFVVFNGDLIHDNPVYMPKVKEIYDKMEIPYYVVKGNHDRISEVKWTQLWNQPADYFFPYKGQYGILILNTSNEAGDYLCVNTEFLKSALDKLTLMPKIFVFIHISQKDWTRHGIDCQEVMNILGENPNVKAIFHGHDHDVDGVMWNQKKPHFWSGHFGGSWGNPFPSYRVCEVDESGKTRTALKRISDGIILNAHEI